MNVNCLNYLKKNVETFGKKVDLTRVFIGHMVKPTNPKVTNGIVPVKCRNLIINS